ncbi:MAG: DEAD/DEAH box helicase [Methanomicrobiales archaeon]|nr:DEAD/DEAH box helicase [Methanomicrobiales archaeon]
MVEKEIYSHLHPSLRYVLASWMKWEDLRDIQVKAYQGFQTGSDLLIISPTAGGKSEAAFIPVLDRIIKQGDCDSKPVCLYIAPLKALINDIADRFTHILNPLHYDLLVIHGDTPLKKIPDSPVFLLTTPESLMVLLYKRDSSILSSIRYCIIDELHALAGSLRGLQILSALNHLEKENCTEITRIGLSATIGNPEEILLWMKGRNNGVLVTGEKQLKNFEFHIYSKEKSDFFKVLSHTLQGKRSLVFCKSRKDTEVLALALRRFIPDVFVHHSSISPEIRQITEEKTHLGLPFAVLCTSTLELGIDIGDLDLVVQEGPPRSVSSFLQRLGRTGRRGKDPLMYFLSASPEETCHTLSALRNAILGIVEPVISPRFPYDLLAREILLLVISRYRVSLTVFDNLLAEKPYEHISKDSFRDLMRHLMVNEWISRDGDLIIPGETMEKIRKKPGFLFSLIGDQPSSKVISSDGIQIGSIPYSSSDVSSFALGGNVWQKTGQIEGDSIVVSPSGICAAPPNWVGGQAEVSLLVLSGLRSIVAGVPLPFELSDSLIHDVKKFKEQFPPDLPDSSLAIRWDDNRTVLYTFLGKNWNKFIGTFFEKNYQCRYLGSDIYKITFSGIIEKSLFIQGIVRIGSCDWKDLAGFVQYSPAKSDTISEILPESLLMEQWIADTLQIPYLQEIIRSLDIS